MVQSVGRSRARSGHRYRCRLTWVTVVIAVFAASATAAVASPPAVDQYTQHLPTAGGGQGAGDQAPVAQPGLLPSKTQTELASAPDGQLLAQIATASALGAATPTAAATPDSPRNPGVASAGQRRGLAAVVGDSAGAGPSLALLAALVAIVAAGAWKRLRRPEL
jgi:hypothetical protein